MEDSTEDTTTTTQQSKEILRESKPSENISINNPLKIEIEKPEIVIPQKRTNTETVFENLIEIKSKSDSSSESAVIDMEKHSDAKKVDRNKSDIFSLDDKIKSSNTIFSVNGTPSGRINRRREEHSEVFPVGCMGCKEQIEPPTQADNSKITANVKETKSRPISGKFSNRNRNPLTGTGVDSTDEIKKGVNGRRKGYLLLFYL